MGRKKEKGKRKKLRIGIVGYGTIGRAVAEFCKDELSDKIKIAGVFDIDKNKATVRSLDALIKRSDLLVETASVSIVPELLKKALDAGRDVLVMSSGGVAGNPGLLDLAKKKGCKVYLPSGAVCGLDGVKAASLGRIKSIILTTRKPKEALAGAPYIEERNIDLDSIKKETVIFEGSASEAARAFPKNINVCATLSIAGIGAALTRVRIICSPVKKNIHEIELKGDCGNISIRTQNLPSPGNPRTSYLAALSAAAALKDIVGNVRVGT